MKQVTILGSTGSIGTQSLDVVQSNKDTLVVYGLCCDKNIELLAAQIKKFCPKVVAVRDKIKASELKKNVDCEVLSGDDGIAELASRKVDVVVNALVGISGLTPTIFAIKAGNDIALANKETLVAGGDFVMPLAKKYGVKILPVDSEHSAIWQCLNFDTTKKIAKILLTASGGAFYEWDKKDIAVAKAREALKHPTWNMGLKVTIDSATLMNKGFEVIEAMHLYNQSPDNIQVLAHRQSIVHSMIEYQDGSVIAQISYPDMRLPISLALLYPYRDEHCYSPLSFDGLKLTFDLPDYEKFPCLKIALNCAKERGIYPVVLNGANEVLVDMYARDLIKFYDIDKFVQKTFDKIGKNVDICDYEQILEYDILARQTVKDIVAKN
ncbi:MAG: 1-deoxy-D-xylulose-5-phosphate reductoisomerase [Clostridia bacterium]